jgi:hypothetical protein
MSNWRAYSLNRPSPFLPSRRETINGSLTDSDSTLAPHDTQRRVSVASISSLNGVRQVKPTKLILPERLKTVADSASFVVGTHAVRVLGAAYHQFHTQRLTSPPAA